METAWYNVIIDHIYIWPMFSEPRHVCAEHRVLFRLTNVIFFKEDYIAAFFENVCIYLKHLTLLGI